MIRTLSIIVNYGYSTIETTYVIMDTRDVTLRTIWDKICHNSSYETSTEQEIVDNRNLDVGINRNSRPDIS
jgi:hypothetical protein